MRALYAQGANVGILDKNDELGKAIAKELGPRAAFFEMDATKEESVKSAVDATVAKFGSLHGAVTCAGVGAATTTLNKKGGTHNSDVWDFVLKINLYGVFNTCKYAAEYMAKNEKDANGCRGVLVNCASVAALEGQKGQVAYAASKGGVTSMTLPMARDLGSYGIRVNTICPGIMGTPMMAMADEKVRTGLAMSVVAPKRLGLPEEFAQLALHIVDNAYLNGETIRLDGGIRMAYTSKI